MHPSPVKSPSSKSSYSSSSRGGLSNVLKSLAKPFKTSSAEGNSSTDEVPSYIQPTIVGMVDGHDIDHMLYNLSRKDSKFSVNDRIAACQVIRSAVENSSVSSIPEIWYSARDMVSSTNQTEARRAGLRLMKSCIEHDEPAIGSRLSYYRDIINHSNIEDFDLQLAALKSLTSDGRDLIDLYQSGYPLPQILVAWLKRLANETQDIRIGKKKDSLAQWGLTTEENFYGIMRYIINALKFNITSFDDTDLEAVLRQTVEICRKTSQVKDIAICCDIVETVLTYGYIPMVNLSDILEILCGITITVNPQAKQAWDTVRKLVNSHAGNTTVLLLCNILEGNHRAEVNSNTMRGAARLLLSLLKSLDGSQGGEKVTADMPLDVILASYKNSLKVESLRHGLEVSHCIYEIITNPTIRGKITYEIWESDKSSPLEVIYNLSQSDMIHKRSRKSVVSATVMSPSNNGVVPSDQPLKQNQDEVVHDILERFQLITTFVAKIIANESVITYNGPIDILLDFMLDMSPFLSEKNGITIIESLEADHSCSPLSKNWALNFDSIISNFFLDRTWDTQVRQRTIKFARNIYILSWDICEDEVIEKLTEGMFKYIHDEADNEVLVDLLELMVEIAGQCTIESFDKLNQILTDNEVSLFDDSNDNTKSKRLQLVSRSVARIFVSTFKYSPTKAQRAYLSLINISEKSVDTCPLAFIEAARVISRIRVATENWVYLTTPTNLETLAANFKRTQDPKEGLWKYPETISYLTDEYLEVPSTVLKRSGVNLSKGTKDIDISRWLKIVVDIFEKGADWEVYSFVLAHFGPQLMNIQLLCECGEDILRLRRVMCDQISNTKIPGGVTLPKDVTKLDVLVTEIQVLPGMVGYNSILFTKRDTDFIVQAFVLGLSSWEKTAIACIHGLVVCCYEFPLSIKKFLGQIFAKFQTKITTTSSSPHILEFLLGLSRLPSLTDNFTQDEYKRVFGMAFKYIQHAYDLAKQPASSGNDSESRYMSQYLLALAYNVIASWFLTLKPANRQSMAEFITRNLILANGNPNDIDEQSLATLDLISRFTHSDIDLSMQTTINKSGSSKIQDGDSMVTVKRWIYGSCILSIETNHNSGDSQLVVRRPTGTTVFDIHPDNKMIPQVIRDAIMLSQYNKKKKKDENGNDDSDLTSMVHQDEDMNGVKHNYLFSPSYYLLQTIIPTDPRTTFLPMLLPDDPLVHRALSAFDRAPVVDFHKVGIMYIAPGQSTEQEVLGNPTGSRAYRKFLSRLASLVRLKGNKQIYTGGLDTENEMDGEFAYAWNDKITQVIFHTTTLMPNHHNTNFATKKRHIGNDYVNIYYDESGLPFKFDMIQSQFNFINIVISPHTVTFKEPFATGDPDQDGNNNANNNQNEEEYIGSSMSTPESSKKKMNYYRVCLYSREGVPLVFSSCHVKTVSEESLPVFVRNLALVANKFATVWHCEGQYVSNWRYRLQQIHQLRDRVMEKNNTTNNEAAKTNNNKEETTATNNNDDGPELDLLNNLDFFSFT